MILELGSSLDKNVARVLIHHMRGYFTAWLSLSNLLQENVKAYQVTYSEERKL
jgi:hypothetical protein